MSQFSYEMVPHDNYLRVVLRGVLRPGEYSSEGGEQYRAALQHSSGRLLLDCREYRNFQQPDAFRWGDRTAEAYRGFKVAILARPDEARGFFKLAMQQHQIEAELFLDEQDALNWLCS